MARRAVPGRPDPPSEVEMTAAAEDWGLDERREVSTPRTSSLRSSSPSPSPAWERDRSSKRAGRRRGQTTDSERQQRLGSLRRGVASVRRRVGRLKSGAMAGEGVCWCLVRIILPLSFIIGCSLQYDAISLMYLGLLLVCPLVPAPTRRSWQGPLGAFLKTCLALTMLAMLPMVCFQIALLAMPPYGHILQYCKAPEPLLRQLGLIRLDQVSILTCVFYFVSKLLPFVITAVTFRECRELARHGDVPETNGVGGGTSPLIQNTREQLQKDGLKYCFVTALTFLSLAGAAIIRPSVTSSVYLLTLMCAMTWWACLRPLGRSFGVVCRLLMAYSAAHLAVLYAYQLQWPQQYFDHTSLAARLAGLVQIKVANCTGDPRDMVFADTTWDVYMYPLVIYALYYMLAHESRILASLRLVEADSLGARYQAVGDAPCPGDDDYNEPAETRVRRERWQRLSATVYTVWRSLARASFLATYVVMMYWSIKYHSYLTFVFLVWALVVAVIKNQRMVMHRSSPVLVAYAQLLVLLQFVYCLDLTDHELPVQINNFDLRDVVYKPSSFPCETLALQLVFTTIFWLTLRQYLQEKRDRHNDLHLTPRRRLSLDDGLLKRWGVVLFKGIVRCWIVIVAIMLFVYGIGEERVVIIQIFYMAFFLFFISMFQISFRIWRRLLYGFTMALILYQMLVLVTIYLYQFKHVHQWITDLGISQQWQRDLGLEVYQTGRLFIKLLFPTLFMIVCVVYIQHIHKDFMTLTDEDRYRRRPEPTGAAASPPASPPAESHSPAPAFSPSADTINNTVDTVDTMDTVDTADTADTVRVAGEAPVAEPEEEMGVLPGDLLEVHTSQHGPPLDETSSLKEVKGWLFHYCARAWNMAVAVLDKLLWIFCRLMEIHGMKVNLFAIMMVTVFDVCAVHFCLLLVVCVALLLEVRGQTVCCHLAICWVSLLLLLRMIYQMDVIPGDMWSVNCTFKELNMALAVHEQNTTVNGLQWFGLDKNTDLPGYVTGYIGVILVLTVCKCVSIRTQYRVLREGHVPPEGVFFVGIGRAQSDHGLLEMTKYLVNYCFYKFGVEITLISLVILVGVRLDVISVLYSLWLCCLFSLHRTTLARVWPAFVVFAAVLTPLQYLLALGLPPALCFEYPYMSVMNPELRQWLYLPDYQDPPLARKLMADFFLLLLACCQRRVFLREECEAVRQLAGSNRPIDEVKLRSGYVIGVADYITSKGTYLDVLKRVVFFSSYWLTLAVVFLAGINRITLLSLLYVASAFIFLWKGTDFYLLPFRDIRKRWILLLTYCVVVITLKCSVFQMMGCVFLRFFMERACWFVQLMGIGCLQRMEPAPVTVNKAVSSECPVPHSEAGLLWDGIVFGCLLLQLRFFSSHYFQHLVLETRAQQMLASSGAEMIERERKKKIEKRQAEEEKAMADIRRKMERIKEQRIQKHRQKYDNHYQVIHSCAAEDLELDLERELEEPPPELAPPADDASREISPGQLLLSGIMKDFSSAAEDARKARRRSGEEQLPAAGERAGPVRRRATLQRAKSHHVPSRQGSPRARLTRLHSDPAPRTHQLPASSLATLQSQDSQDDDEPPVAPPDGREPNDSENSGQEGVGEKALASLLRRTILGLRSAGNFLLEFMASILIALTVKLNNVSADYRYISKKLSKEKRRLKESWQPGGPSPPSAGAVRPTEVDRGAAGDAPLLCLTQEETPPPAETAHRPTDLAVDSADTAGEADTEECVKPSVSEDLSTASARQILEQLAVALWYAVVSRSEMVAYIVVFINQMVSASILSLPLPMMVFFWGSLSVPRPSKTFWVTMIAYTETIIIIKYMFQFDFFPWNQVEKLNAPFWPPRILGVERKDQYAVYDLVLLLIIFFHRVVMKTLGLWKDVDDEPGGDVAATPAADAAAEDHLGNTRLTVTERGRAAAHKAKGELVEGFKFYVSAVGEFFKSLLSNSGKEKVDVYAYMFICDFINIFVVFLGFSSFGPPQGGSGDDISSVVEENRVPIPFLIILSLNFLLILVDRALYLRKTALWKLVFQYVLVVVVHGWLFFVLPAMTDREFDQAVAPRVWYMIKCIYLLFSAYQIRSGYPTRILGNFLTKQYTFFNKMAFRGFMLIPFLYELRALMDWMWTKTSLDIFNWLKMEDIYAHIFLIKCQRVQEVTQVYVSGEPRRTTEKCVFGGGWLLLIVAVIFAPLVLFALSNAVGLTNVPYEVTVEISVGAYQPIFRMTAEQNSILSITEKDLDDISFHYRSDRRALGFLADYDYTDVNVIRLSGKSTAVWAISPPSQTRLIQDLVGNETMTLKLAWTVKRLSNSAAVSAESIASRKVELTAYTDDHVRNPIRERLAAMLRGDLPAGSNVSIPHMFPKFIRVTNQGKASLVSELAETTHNDPESAWRALNLTLMRDNETEVEWWEVQEDCRDGLYSWLPYATCSLLLMVSFSQRSFPSTLTYITGTGIIGSYTTFVLVIGRLCRTPFVDISFHIMFDELPYVDRILQICEDIYLVRERGNLALEEELFAKLIFLYRSPEMMIKYTEPPREDNSQ